MFTLEVGAKKVASAGLPLAASHTLFLATYLTTFTTTSRLWAVLGRFTSREWPQTQWVGGQDVSSVSYRIFVSGSTQFVVSQPAPIQTVTILPILRNTNAPLPIDIPFGPPENVWPLFPLLPGKTDNTLTMVQELYSLELGLQGTLHNILLSHFYRGLARYMSRLRQS